MMSYGRERSVVRRTLMLAVLDMIAQLTVVPGPPADTFAACSTCGLELSTDGKGKPYCSDCGVACEVCGERPYQDCAGAARCSACDGPCPACDDGGGPR